MKCFGESRIPYPLTRLLLSFEYGEPTMYGSSYRRAYRAVHGKEPNLGSSDDIFVFGVNVAKAVVKAPKGFWNYMTKDIGKEHAEEEEQKRQAILANRKK